jgi:hypothetical protein
MKAKQGILLFLALLLPICVFIFLKIFGKNEFEVPPMFANGLPSATAGCPDQPSLPYRIPNNISERLELNKDSLACIYFSQAKNLDRVKDEYMNFPLQIISGDNFLAERKCIFLLVEPFDIVLVDKKGRIRGQYDSSDRDEIDRLITELAIIFKKY